jgi:hypothetical protein
VAQWIALLTKRGCLPVFVFCWFGFAPPFRRRSEGFQARDHHAETVTLHCLTAKQSAGPPPIQYCKQIGPCWGSILIRSSTSLTTVSPCRHEAVELRDGDASKFHGRGVSRAVANVNTVIAPALIGKDPTKQAEIDQLMCKELDKTEYKAGLGANAIMAVSIAVCMAGENGALLFEILFISLQVPGWTSCKFREGQQPRSERDWTDSRTRRGLGQMKFWIIVEISNFDCSVYGW